MATPPTGFQPEDEALFETLNQYFVIEIWAGAAAIGETGESWRTQVIHGTSGERWVGDMLSTLAQTLGLTGLER